MNTKLAVLAGVVVVAVVAIVVRMRSHGPVHRKVDPNREPPELPGTDNDLSLTAMMNAPEGATPCETAYGAIDAEREASKLRGSKSLFQWVAPKPEFLAACQALPEETQRCMMPRYRRDHADDCVRVRPSPEQLKKLVVSVPDGAPGPGSGQAP